MRREHPRSGPSDARQNAGFEQRPERRGRPVEAQDSARNVAAANRKTIQRHMAEQTPIQPECTSINPAQPDCFQAADTQQKATVTEFVQPERGFGERSFSERVSITESPGRMDAPFPADGADGLRFNTGAAYEPDSRLLQDPGKALGDGSPPAAPPKGGKPARPRAAMGSSVIQAPTGSEMPPAPVHAVDWGENLSPDSACEPGDAVEMGKLLIDREPGSAGPANVVHERERNLHFQKTTPSASTEKRGRNARFEKEGPAEGARSGGKLHSMPAASDRSGAAVDTAGVKDGKESGLRFQKQKRPVSTSASGGSAPSAPDYVTESPVESGISPDTAVEKRPGALSNAAPSDGDPASAVSERPKKGRSLRFEETGHSVTGKDGKALRFDNGGKPAKASKLRHADAPSAGGRAGGVKAANRRAGRGKLPGAALGTAAAVPFKAVDWGVHQGLSEYEDDNAGVESAHRLGQSAESGAKRFANSARTRRMNTRRQSGNAGYRQKLQQNKAILGRPRQQEGKPLSRSYQKKAIKKQYADKLRKAKNAGISAARSSAKSARAADKSVKAARKAAQGTETAAAFVWRHKSGLLILGIAVLTLTFILNVMSSCSVMLEGGTSVLGSSTFPNRDEDMLGAEAAYAAMEAELQAYLDGYENTHDYDEYSYDLDEIGHDPYVLIAMLSALNPGGWSPDGVGDTLETMFAQQYVLTETVTSETREGDDGEPYTYSICTVKLENTDLARQTATSLDEDGLHLYATYMATRGNRPDLFPTSEYPNASTQQEYLHYDVPPEALEDETFAAMLKEAEKYLGYPYVWGGASPSTSFDCSGYVSWVINHSGWNVGRLTAQGLFNICTPVTAANARPGDLVLFKGTYNTTEVSHVGIYVGNHMMIHCGSPISYANLNENYWQQHLYCYGRLPAAS